MKIALVGYMASGKSLVGEGLSKHLGIPFIDLDSEIEKTTGHSISELISLKSELHFRKIERQELLRVLKLPKFVLSCGGGTPCYYNNMEELTVRTQTFYLQETPKTLADRLISEKQNRPLISSIEDKEMFEFVAKHIFERRPYYESAQHTIRGNNKIEQIVELVNRFVQKNTVLTNILERRTIKPDRYSGNTIDDSLIEEMLLAAHWAPTHGNTEPWAFKVFTGEGRNVLFEFLKQWHIDNGDNAIRIEKTRKRIFQTSHIISIGMKRGDNPKIPEIEEVLAVGAAVQNMWLVAHANGLGAYWSTGARAFQDRMRNFLDLQEVDKSLGFLYVGEKATDDMDGHRLTKIEDKVEWVRS